MSFLKRISLFLLGLIIEFIIANITYITYKTQWITVLRDIIYDFELDNILQFNLFLLYGFGLLIFGCLMLFLLFLGFGLIFGSLGLLSGTDPDGF